MTRDVTGRIGRGVTPRDTGKVITKLLNNRWPLGGEDERQWQQGQAQWGGGKGNAPGHTLRPMKWINDSIVNFVGKDAAVERT